MDEKSEEKYEEIENTEQKGSVFWEITKFVIITLFIVVPIRFWVAQPFIVSGASMVPTLLDGDYLIVDEISHRFNGYERGDVIVFKYPQDPSKFFIKRIIGLPGDRVVMQDGTIFLYSDEFKNGVLLDEPYINGVVTGPNETATLGENEYFVLGDNRRASFDSRAWGAVPEKFIVGRAAARLWPFNKISLNPGDYMFASLEIRDK